MLNANGGAETPAIEARGLVKTYKSGDGEVLAVRGLDLTVAPGEIYALLGPNGAGKTTTISILTTLLQPSQGSARVAGYDVVTQAAEVRRRIGVTFQEVVLDQELTGRQVLDFHAQLYGMSKARRLASIDELAALVELTDVLDRKSARYSGGMKRRLELARGLMTEPAILFLDEPTQGLDPQNRAGIWRYVRNSAPNAESPCSSPPTRWMRPNNWPTASASSTTAGSSSREASMRLCATWARMSFR